MARNHKVLFNSLSFFRDYWESKPFYSSLSGLKYENHDAIDELKSLYQSNLRQLLYLAASNNILKWSFGPENTHSHEYVNRDIALSAFKDCNTLYFHIDSAHLSSLRTFVAEALGDIPFKLSIFASPKGANVASHFDANNNFTIQLRGSKKWIYSPNIEIPYPTKNWMPSVPIDHELLLYSPGFLSSFANTSIQDEIVLNQADLFYLPRGFWHQTYTLEDSFSLNICIPSITKAKVVSERVYQMLLKHTAWRQHVPLSSGINSSQISSTSVHLQTPINQFICSLDPEIVFDNEHGSLGSTDDGIHASTLIFKPTLSRYLFVDNKSDDEKIDVIFISPETTEMTLSIDKSLVVPLSLLSQFGSRSFAVKELFSRHMDHKQILDLMALLVKFGFFCIV